MVLQETPVRSGIGALMMALEALVGACDVLGKTGMSNLFFLGEVAITRQTRLVRGHI